MASNTGPAELAEIIENEKKFRTYMVLTTQEIKEDLKTHKVDDNTRFDRIEARLTGVSSSVGGLEKIKHRFEGGWSTIAVIAALLVFLLDIGFKIAELVK